MLMTWNIFLPFLALTSSKCNKDKEKAEWVEFEVLAEALSAEYTYVTKMFPLRMLCVGGCDVNIRLCVGWMLAFYVVIMEIKLLIFLVACFDFEYLGYPVGMIMINWILENCTWGEVLLIELDLI